MFQTCFLVYIYIYNIILNLYQFTFFDALSPQRSKKYSVEAQESRWEILRHIVFGAENNAEQSSTFTRMAVLEARADKRALKNTLAFLPFVMFLVFGFVLGTLVKIIV